MSQNFKRWVAGLLLGLSASYAAAEGAPYSPDMLELDGETGVVFSTHPLLGIADQGTLEFWVAADWQGTPATSPTLLSNVGPKGTAYTIRIAPDRKSIELQSGTELIRTEFDFSDGGLNHVAYIDFGDTTTLVINGAILDTFTFSIEPVATDAFWVGSAADNAAPFRGAIAALRIWDMPVLPDVLAEYALQGLEAADAIHPDINFLVGRSDFKLGDLAIVDFEPLPPEETDQ